MLQQQGGNVSSTTHSTAHKQLLSEVVCAGNSAMSMDLKLASNKCSDPGKSIEDAVISALGCKIHTDHNYVLLE